MTDSPRAGSATSPWPSSSSPQPPSYSSPCARTHHGPQQSSWPALRNRPHHQAYSLAAELLAQLLLAAFALRRFRIDFPAPRPKPRKPQRPDPLHRTRNCRRTRRADHARLIFLLLRELSSRLPRRLPRNHSLTTPASATALLGFVLLHSISPLLPIVIAWLIVLALQRKILDWSRNCGAQCATHRVLFGLLNCVAQQRALLLLPLHPLLIFLLPLIAMDFTTATTPGAPSMTVPSSCALGSRFSAKPQAF